MTERKAWELLSLVDQIHLWGVTDFRNFVIQHLKPWHDFRKNCNINDVNFMATNPSAGNVAVNGAVFCKMPSSCLVLPEWTKYVPEDTRLKLQKRVTFHMWQAYNKYQRDVRAKSDEFPGIMSCQIGECGPLGSPGYPLASIEEGALHLREVHGADEAYMTRLNDSQEEGRIWFLLSTLPHGMTGRGGILQSSGPVGRNALKQPLEDNTTNKVNESKRRKR